MEVAFELWPRSELIDRLLAVDLDGGRRRFWFDVTHFGIDWFKRHVADAVLDAGPRYHPELNVDVPISQTFAAFGRTPEWLHERLRRLRDFEEKVTQWERRIPARAPSEATSALKTSRRPSLSIDACKRWILEEIRRQGFDDRFDKYDGCMLHHHGGGRGRPMWAERVGKKYQWIALYRLVGLVEDNVQLEADDWEPDLPADAPPRLQAPGERNLDPTITVKRTATDRYAPNWWTPTRVDFHPDLSPEQWLDELDFPDSTRLIEFTEPDGREWLALHSYPEWDDRVDRDDWDTEYRHAWIQLRSYLVAVGDAEKLWRWLRKQDFHGRWMPEGPRWISYVFAGEYPWAVQAQHALEGSTESPAGPPVELQPTVYEQSLEFEFDSYHDGTIHLLVPAPLFFAADGLSWDGAGAYLNPNGGLHFRDFSEPGPRALLVEREGLLAWLEQHQLRIVWTTLSEMHWSAPGFVIPHDFGYAVHSRCHRLVDGVLRVSRGITRRVRPGDES